MIVKLIYGKLIANNIKQFKSEIYVEIFYLLILESLRGKMEKAYETNRLILKVLDKSYANIVLEYHINNKQFLEAWEPIKDDEFYNLEYQEDSLEMDLIKIKNNSMVKFWIFKKDEPNKVIGSVGFSNIVRGAFLSCHLGYRLDRNEINKGFMTEATKKGIDIMFNEFQLHRIEANIMPKNLCSLKVVEKLGFYHEGLAKKYLKINNVWEDHIHMVLLNENL
jgi:[ribosomal protein S5]-alanine N-acetyltransferase